MKLTGRRIKEFRTFIFRWWKTNRRDLPWRRTRDPYKILISEVMLQQTQVSRVLTRYLEFIERYPTADSLANASAADVLRIWKGMGYNRRALYLKKSAEFVTENYHGKFPESENELYKLPGVGTYTARAILVFAYKQNVALVDTNIRQIITHFFFGDKKQKESVIQNAADRLVPAGKSWEWHQALMDYGATALKKVPGVVRKQKQFKGSNRFYRGKVIDLLRAGSVSERILLRDFSPSVIEGLLKDGLVARSSRTISLPT